MTPTDQIATGIVVEAYNHDESHRILTVRLCEFKCHFFFYVKRDLGISFGDTIKINLPKEKFAVIRKPVEQSFEFECLPFPGTLLLELISERINL